MRTKRLIWFLVMIAIGAAGGLAYGWVLNPVKYVDTTPQTLRADYKADYTLMVAEIYKSDHDLTGAVRRLAFLGSQPPAQMVTEAISTAEKLSFPDADLATLRQLYQVLPNTLAPTPAEKQP